MRESLGENTEDRTGVNYYTDVLDLRAVWAGVWSGRGIIVGTTLLFTIAAMIYALSMPNIYRSEVLLAPVSTSDQSGITPFSGLGGLASLAGLNLSSGRADKAVLALEIVRSRAFIAEFIEKHKLHVPLAASSGWDANSEKWIIDSEIYNEAEQSWLGFGDEKLAEPSSSQLYRKFISLLSISQSKETGLVNIAIVSQSPLESKRWLSMLVEDLNEHMRRGDIQEANAIIEYLSGQIKKTPIAEMQNIFFQLIEQQMKTVMLAEV
ncbi:Wzz/FepE/Etk N-terminal domain-containing protein, partial [Litorivivens sp.]